MKSESKFIYYGILFYFLYSQIYNIISNVLILPILSMHWNIYLIPILLGVFIVILSLWFYRLKKFPKIKLWIILLIVSLSITTELFSWVPYNISKESYINEEKSLILDFTLYCKTINTVIFIIITSLKYTKMKKSNELNSNVDNI